MSHLQRFYNKCLALLHTIEPNDHFFNHTRKPKLSDKEWIALSLAAEATSIDSELSLFKQLPPEVENKIERSVYNKRRRHLSLHTQQIQKRLADTIIPHETHHLIDSMPLEVCKFSRAKRSRVCTEYAESSPDYGYCAAQKLHYFGYKIHAVCTQQGVFKAFDISKASVHDIHYLNDIGDQFEQCVLIGDKGYLSQTYQADLFATSAIQLQTPSRSNQLEQKPFPPIYRKARKRIETLFSQLCDQFMIRRNYAKSFKGFSARIVAKLTSLTLIQLSNKLLGNNINNLKIAIC